MYVHIVSYVDFFPKDGNYLYDGCSLYQTLFYIYIAFFSFPFLLFSLNHLKTLTGRVENWGKTVISFYK